MICPLRWSPLRQKNLNDLPIVVEPIEAKSMNDLPIVVEPVEAKSINDLPIVVEPVDEQYSDGKITNQMWFINMEKSFKGLL